MTRRNFLSPKKSFSPRPERKLLLIPRSFHVFSEIFFSSFRFGRGVEENDSEPEDLGNQGLGMRSILDFLEQILFEGGLLNGGLRRGVERPEARSRTEKNAYFSRGFVQSLALGPPFLLFFSSIRKIFIVRFPIFGPLVFLLGKVFHGDNF